MEEQKISVDTAKLAKEKGFDDIECNGYYHINSGYSSGYAFCYSCVSKQENSAILSPTQSLLQKWIREVHDIEIAVQWFDKGYIFAVNRKPFKANTYKVSNINSYEEALEVALVEALKLIK